MKVAKVNSGEILKGLEKEISEAAKTAGLTGAERGFLNNALLQASPATAEKVKELLQDPKKLVEQYQARQAAKLARPATPLEAAVKTAAKELNKVAQASGLDKTKLNAALVHHLSRQKEPTPEAALKALEDPAALMQAYEARVVKPAAAPKAAEPAPAAPDMGGI